MFYKMKDSFKEKFVTQDKLYEFPYHYIPHFDEEGIASRYRLLKWGFEYLCYIKHSIEIVESLRPNSVLDVGCGDGRFLGLLNDKINRKVGVDLSEKAIQFAKAFNKDNEEIIFKTTDARFVEDKFDVVTAIEVLEHIPDNEIASFLKTLEEKAKSGGYVLLSVPTIVAPLNKKHYRHYDYNLLVEQLNNSIDKLNIVKTDYVYKETSLSKFYLRLTNNKLWHIELRFINKMFWHYVWHKLRIGSSENGKHIIALLKKVN